MALTEDYNIMIHYEWDLSCNAEIARKMITDSLGNLLTPFPFNFGGFKGIVDDESPASDGSNCTIWESSSWRGLPPAYGKVKITPNGEQSRLSAIIKLRWPLNYFPLGYKVTVPIIAFMVLSWFIISSGAFTNECCYLPFILILINVFLVFILLHRWDMAVGKKQVNNLNKFLEDIFREYILK